MFSNIYEWVIINKNAALSRQYMFGQFLSVYFEMPTKATLSIFESVVELDFLAILYCVCPTSANYFRIEN